MSFSLLVRCAFVLLLSLAVVIRVQSRGMNDVPAVDFSSAMGRSLTDHGFVVINTTEGFFPFIEARSGACALVVGNMSSLGWQKDVLRRSAPPGSEVFVTYDGRRYEDQPRWRTTLDFYWSRLNRVVGRLVTVPPILGVIATPGCRPADWDWLEGLRLA